MTRGVRGGVLLLVIIKVVRVVGVCNCVDDYISHTRDLGGNAGARDLTVAERKAHRGIKFDYCRWFCSKYKWYVIPGSKGGNSKIPWGNYTIMFSTNFVCWSCKR